MANTIEDALDLLNLKQQHEIGVYNMRFVKPLDDALLHSILSTYSKVFTIEDGTVLGGFGSAILEFASQYKYTTAIEILGIPDTFIEQGSVAELQKALGLDATSLAELFLKSL